MPRGLVGTQEQLLQLWMHENLRVFRDRLVNAPDREVFTSNMFAFMQKSFPGLSYEEDHVSQLIFSDIGNPFYKKIDNYEKLVGHIEDSLMLYNNKNKVMSLVFFRDAVHYLCQVKRIISQPRGNGFLVGVGGSGRQSLSRLATSICNYEFYQIEITKSYREQQWKDDLKKLMKLSGTGKPTTFYFNDTQILYDKFLEDINSILNTGEVANVIQAEDHEEIFGEIRMLAQQLGIPEVKDQLLGLFIHLVRENLHIVLGFSPVGAKLRDYTRQFPSIINCSTTIWFDKWSQEALVDVATNQLGNDPQLGLEAEQVQAVSKILVDIHNRALDFSDKLLL